ncbi:MAG: thioredoxin family protein [Calditrichaeota bacterium]|nr:MAG: thioredoxin family protein [Calditrichota bacterium]
MIRDKLIIPLLLGLILLFNTDIWASEPQIGKPAPDFTLVDSHGKKHSLSDYKGKFVVLEWFNPDCPFVRKHYNSGNMQKLQKQYTKKGVIWLTINSSAPGKQGHCTPKIANKIIKKKEMACTAFLLDHDGKVGRMYGAKTTPHMYIINPNGILIYKGAIDDKPSTNIEDIKKAKNYVVMALEAAMKGKKVPVSATKPYGCSVKYKDKT